MIRLTKGAILAVVGLRLLLGWHFYNEGVKKLEPGFTSAGFLRTAKGPFAPIFRSMVRGPYDAHAELAVPVEYSEYQQGEPREDSDPHPGDAWVDNISEGWEIAVRRLGELDEPALSAETLEAIEAARIAAVGRVRKYVHSTSEEIAELQHESWLLQQLREDAGHSPPPYLQARIDEKAADNWITMQPWISSVQLIEEKFVSEVAQLAEADEVSRSDVQHALAEQSFLSTIDFIVTCVVLGCGICLFLGLATPIAAILAAGFLFSLMLTQPPWVTGPDVMKNFFTWAIEFAALLVVATLGAGRWAGLDGVFNYLWLKSRGRLPRERTSKPHLSGAAA